MRVSRALLAQATKYAELRELLSAPQFTGRTHILDRKFCEETIGFIRHTLPEKHKCDVVEISPGIGVWSQAIHEELQPRRHVLVEPQKEQYSQWLDPLLRQPASRYRYAPNIHAALDPDNALLSPEVIQLGTRIKEASSQGKHSKTSTDTLLIVANLANTYRKIPGFTGTEAKSFLNSYYRALFSGNENIHRYGLVRMLAWLDVATQRMVTPTTVVSHCKQSIQLDSAFSMTVVTTPFVEKRKHTHRHRWYDIDAENFRNVINSQKRLGIKHPLHRLPQPPQLPLEGYEPDIDFIAANRRMFPTSGLFVEQLLSVRELLMRTNPSWFAKYEKQMERRATLGITHGKNLGAKEPEAQALYRKLITRLKTHHKAWQVCTNFINEHRALWREFASAFKAGITFKPGSSDKADELLKKYTDLKARTEALRLTNKVRIQKAVDDYRCYDAEPPTLTWNRRTYEPMQCDRQEFHPTRKPLALVDFVPRQEHVDQLDTLDKQICYYYVVTNMMIHPADTVPQAIQRLIPAGYDEFTKGLRDMDNVPRGGWHDLENLRIRTLHYDYFVQIALAYEKWPHRPSATQLLGIAATVYDPPL